MQRARLFWIRRGFAVVAAITTTSGAEWCWRLTDVDGTELEESDEFFPTITAALAAGRRRLTARDRRRSRRQVAVRTGSDGSTA